MTADARRRKSSFKMPSGELFDLRQKEREEEIKQIEDRVAHPARYAQEARLDCAKI